jgi:uncharacterized ferredoxin-like protein
MPISNDISSEQEAMIQLAKMLLVSARTAPKSKGLDTIHTAIITGEEKVNIAEKMRSYAQQEGDPWYRDAKNIENSAAIVLIGVEGVPIEIINCGLCGFNTCEEFLEFRNQSQNTKPCCTFKLIDLGIALGSAAKTASIHNVDCRIMYRPGKAAKELGYLQDVDVLIAIPLSATGKSIYFDR